MADNHGLSLRGFTPSQSDQETEIPVSPRWARSPKKPPRIKTTIPYRLPAEQSDFLKRAFQYTWKVAEEFPEHAHYAGQVIPGPTQQKWIQSIPKPTDVLPEPIVPEYEPTYWENPYNVARWYSRIKAGDPIPEWVDAEAVQDAYDYFSYVNQGFSPGSWLFLPPSDPARTYLKTIPQPPAEEYLRETLPPEKYQEVLAYNLMQLPPEQWTEDKLSELSPNTALTSNNISKTFKKHCPSKNSQCGRRSSLAQPKPQSLLELCRPHCQERCLAVSQDSSAAQQ